MNAGKLRWPISIERPDQNQTATGELSGDWISMGADRACIKPSSGSNNEAGLPQRESLNWYEVTTRYNPDIGPGKRLLITGDPYDGLTFFVSDAQHTLTETTAKCFQRQAG